jgi:hypothetical protein
VDERLTHLTLLQAVIARMGTNSFLLKGWSVTLVAAIFALAAKDSERSLVLLAYFPILVFWGLDAFFLHQEKLFRRLYEEVAAGRIPSNSLSMDTLAVRSSVPGAPQVAFSKTLIFFHGTVVGVVLLAMWKIF